jgi:hypothetical protein
MNLIQLAFLALVFLAVFGMVYALMARIAGDPVQHRLQTMAEPRPHQPTRSGWHLLPSCPAKRRIGKSRRCARVS